MATILKHVYTIQAKLCGKEIGPSSNYSLAACLHLQTPSYHADCAVSACRS